jgi:protein phosphatase
VEGGAEAAFAAVHYAQALYYAPPGPDDPAARLPQVVEGVNALNRLEQRAAAAADAATAMSHLTTLIAAVVFPTRLWIANLGDSRAYLLTPNAAPLQLTEDHRGRVQQSKAATLPTPPAAAQADLPPNLITRAIGLSDTCQVDVYRYPWEPPQRLLLCSDGLFALPPARLTELAFLPDVQEAARALVAAAVELDGQDNCTVILASHASGESA